MCESFGFGTLHQLCPSILKTTSTTLQHLHGDCALRPLYKKKNKQKKTTVPLKKKKKRKKKPRCVGVCFRLSKPCQVPEKWPCLNEVSRTEGVRVKPRIKEVLCANILFIIVLCNALHYNVALLFACHVFVFYSSQKQ